LLLQSKNNNAIAIKILYTFEPSRPDLMRILVSYTVNPGGRLTLSMKLFI